MYRAHRPSWNSPTTLYAYRSKHTTWSLRSDLPSASSGVGSGPTFEPAVPKPLFEAHFSTLFPGVAGAAYYAVTGDGQRFLLNTLAGDSTIVLNRTAGLRQ